jgi:hypothetical protein
MGWPSAITLEAALASDAGPAYYDAIQANDPVGYWRLGETSGTNAIDSSGYNNTGGYIGSPALNQASLLAGDSNPSVDFNGTTQYVTVASSASLSPSATFSLEIIMRPDTIDDVNHNILIRKELAYGYQFLSTMLGVYYWDAAGAVWVFWCPYTFVVATTYHVVFTKGIEKLRAYVNGQKIWEGNSPGSTVMTTGGSAVLIGKYAFHDLSNFDGRLDEPAIYWNELSEDQVAYHYAAMQINPNPVWTDLSSRLLEATVERGRDDWLEQPDTGKHVYTMNNKDRALDPSNTASAYYPNITPIKETRLRATWNSITYDIARGAAEDWPPNWLTRQIEVVALDAFEQLNGAEILINRPAELSGARVHAILDAAAWPLGLRAIDAGVSVLQAVAMNDPETAADMLRKVAQSENGMVFVNGAGSVVFHDRQRRWLSPYTTIQLFLSNDPGGGELPHAEARLASPARYILNDAKISKAEGAIFVAFDPVSMTKRRRRTHAIEVILNDDNECQAMAEYFVSNYKDPVPFIEEVVLHPQLDDALWPHALGREMGDRVQIEVFPQGGGSAVVSVVQIEKVQHVIKRFHWTTTWKCSRADTNQYWILGTSQLGVDTRLGY